MDAKKERFGADDVPSVAQGMTKLLVAKGKKVTTVDLKKEAPDDAALASLLLGPTGNLRAPTLKTGKTLIVGFNDEMYSEVFG
ncbi:ArsC family (seleno)protein [Stieleria marina]